MYDKVISQWNRYCSSNYKKVSSQETTKSNERPVLSTKEFIENSKYFSCTDKRDETYEESLFRHYRLYDKTCSSDKENLIKSINNFFSYALYIYGARNDNAIKEEDYNAIKKEIYDLISCSKNYIEYMNKVFSHDFNTNYFLSNSLLIDMMRRYFFCNAKGISKLIADENDRRGLISFEEINDNYKELICILAHFNSKDNIIKQHRLPCNLESIIKYYKKYLPESFYPYYRNTVDKQVYIYFDISLKENFADKDLNMLIKSLKETMDLINDYTKEIFIKNPKAEKSIIDYIEKFSTLGYGLEEYLKAKDLGHLAEKIDPKYLKENYKIKNIVLALNLARIEKNKYAEKFTLNFLVFVIFGSAIASTGIINNLTVSLMIISLLMSVLLFSCAGYYFMLHPYKMGNLLADPKDHELAEAFANIF